MVTSVVVVGGCWDDGEGEGVWCSFASWEAKVEVRGFVGMAGANLLSWRTWGSAFGSPSSAESSTQAVVPWSWSVAMALLSACTSASQLVLDVAMSSEFSQSIVRSWI